MPRARACLLSLLLLPGLPAGAAPPPGHPSVEQAGQALGLPTAPDALPLEATVLEAIDSNSYTYLRVRQGDRESWLAAPRLAAAPGATLRFAPGRTLTDFYSKKLKRTFAAVTFVPRAEVID